MKHSASLLFFFISFLFSQTHATEELAAGANLTGLKIESQFDEALTLNSDTKYIFFTSDKAASNLMHESITESKFDLNKQPVLYISDISKMPSMITKMFAIPKMKKYSYKMGLDRTGDITKQWPRKEGQIAKLTLEKEIVKSIEFYTDKEALTASLKSMDQAPATATESK